MLVGKQWFLAAMATGPVREVKVNTLEGGVFTVKVLPTNTIEELKDMLREKKHCEDPIERQILKVKVLVDTLLVDDDQTLESAGLLHSESEVTAIYSRNEVEAAAKEEIHAKGLLQVNIPSSLTEIPARAFQGQNQVVKVTIPESVTVIANGAFAECESLASITIPVSVKDIGHNAFEGCESLASITIPNSVTAIGDSAFANCESLASITIPESVTGIAERAFEGCKSLASITIPNSVTFIGEFAFANCESLASITIPESVTEIAECAFVNCESLASITIPESVTEIWECAFQGCKSLASITIPNSVTRIADFAFVDCESLANITWFPESVTDIGVGAFSGCKSAPLIAIIDKMRIWRGAFSARYRKRRKVWLCCLSHLLELAFSYRFSIWMSFHVPCKLCCQSDQLWSSRTRRTQRKERRNPRWWLPLFGGNIQPLDAHSPPLLGNFRP